MPSRSQALAGAFLKMKMNFSSQVINILCTKQPRFAAPPPHPLFLFSSQEEGEVDTGMLPHSCSLSLAFSFSFKKTMITNRHHAEPCLTSTFPLVTDTLAPLFLRHVSGHRTTLYHFHKGTELRDTENSECCSQGSLGTVPLFL